MASKTNRYPRTKFQLTPSMNVREIVLVGPAQNRFGERYGYGVDTKGKQHYLAWLHDTRQAALEAGEAKMDEQEKRLETAKVNVAKRRANLNKAKGATA